MLNIIQFLYSITGRFSVALQSVIYSKEQLHKNNGSWNRIFLFLMLALFLTDLFGQGLQSKEIGDVNKIIGINFAPLAIVDSYPRLRLGVEYSNGKKVALALDAGMGNSSFIKISNPDSSNPFKEFSIYEIRPEVKLFYVRNKSRSWYIAWEMFYIVKEQIYQNDYYYESNSTQAISYDYAKYNLKKMGLHFNTGLEIITLERIKLNIYGGIGFAYRQKYYSDQVISENDYSKEDHYLWYEEGYKKENTSIIPHFTLGFKIGIIIFEKQ